jgi:hypothetical protein
MIHVIYDKNGNVAYNDVQILSLAEQIVISHGSTEDVFYVHACQDLFLTSLRSYMKQHEIAHTNMTIDIVIDDINSQRVTLTDNYRLSDYTNIPDLISDILMPLL